MLLASLLPAQQGLLQGIQLNDYYRRAQVTGADSVAGSFCVQPRLHERLFGKKKDTLVLSSVIGYTLQNNSLLPYGYNDESLYPASGFQQRFTAGIQAESKYFSVKLQPEWVYAANTVHDELVPPATSSLNNYWGRYIAMLANRIDMPSRFGDSSISRVFPGQSFIRGKLYQFSAGVSTENLWWGPARYNALIMGNNAPGFLHATINTDEPVPTPIGNLEAQFVYGRLTASGVTPPEFERIAQAGCPQCYVPPPATKNRDAFGYVVSLSPRGLDNLHVGVAYMSYYYADTSLRSSRLGSLFFRYVMPKDDAEIYAEYGRSDKFMSPFDLFRDSVPYGYTVGLRKLVPLRNRKSFISISAELSHLGLPKADMILDRNNVFGPPNPNSYSWYTSPTITHGYTNYGQGMGAAIGTGSNSQTLDIAWVKGQNQLGLQLQRVVRNTDFYYYHYFNGLIGGGNTSAFWTDLSASLYGQWQYRRFLFAGSVHYLSSLNYGWLKLDGGFDDPSSLSDKRNFQVRLSVLYSINWLAPGKSGWPFGR
jgi:hypothetical protein